MPLTFKLDPTGAVIMLAGIFNGAMYGGSTTSILMRIPGEAASVVTCLDGYEMAKNGRAGAALTIAAVGSFVGGTLSIIGLMAVGPLLADAMLTVGPAAEFVLMVTALLVVSAVSNSPPVKTLAMIVLGLALGTVGLDPLTAYPRFTFGSLDLTDGFNFVALSIGLFGVSEILLTLDEAVPVVPRAPRLRDMPPTRAEIKEATPAVLRGSVIGFLFGLVPGVSHIISTFVSYAVEKKLSRTPEKFGHGAVAGVAGPETANNATTGASMIPLMILGIPAIPATAILLSALLIHGVQPGPLLMSEHPQVFWGLIASMYLGNIILVDSQSAAGRHFCVVVAHADRHSRAAGAGHLLDRCLFAQRVAARSDHRRRRGGRRISAAEILLRRCAAAAGVRARRPIGTELPPRPHHFGW